MPDFLDEVALAHCLPSALLLATSLRQKDPLSSFLIAFTRMSLLHQPAVRRLVAALFFLIAVSSSGQENAPIAADAVDQKVEKLASQTLAPEVREEALAIWADARSQASKYRAAKKRIPNYEREIKEAPQKLTETIDALAKAPVATTAEELAPLSANEVKSLKTNTEAELLTKQSQLETLLTESQKREERQKVIPGDIIALSQERPAPAPELEAEPAISEAWAEFQNVRDPAFLQVRLLAMELEQKFYTATGELHSLRKRLVQREIAHLQEQLKLLQEVVEQKTTEEATALRETTQAQAVQYSDIPALAALAGDNSELAQERENVSQELAAAQALIDSVNEQLAQVQSQSQVARDRIQLLQSAEMEIDAETGRLLRLERAELPSIPSLKAALRSALKSSTQGQLARLELEKRILAEPFDIDAEAKRIQDEIGEYPEIALADIRELLLKRQALESGLAEDYRLLITRLETATTSIQNLATEARNYSLFLDERLIWIASAPRIRLSDFATEQAALQRLAVHDFAQVWIPNFRASFRTKPLGWIAVIIATTFLILRRRSYRHILRTTAEEAARRTCTSFKPTGRALFYTLLLALPVPLFMGALAWLVPEPSHLATALIISAIFVFLFTTFRRMSSRYGLFRNHFQMSQAHGKLLHRHLTWFLAIEPIILFLFFALSTNALEPQAGRLFFIVAMALLLVFVQAILLPKRGLIPTPKHLKRLPHLIFLIALLIPLLFILGSSFGYISSVDTLRQQTMTSVWLILLSVLVARLSERWILVSRRELARTQALKSYQARLKALEKESQRKAKNASSDNSEPLPTPEELELKAIDVVTVEDQTKKLVRIAVTTLAVFGILNIWAPSLQALSFLDRVTIWGGGQESVIETIGNQSGLSSLGIPSPATTEGEPAPAPSGTAPAAQPERSRGVSLQDLALALIALLLTVLAAKNLPGLLELSLLRHLDLKPGGNYAVTTIMRYAISAIGILIAFGLLSVTWSSVQWLAAAITLGIGFGLQEIFANFVAGIILLFERPIRVGDVVTVGEVSGAVTKIEMRATTIRQFNSRELVVPNKEFITGQLVNWTLSDELLRFDVVVGVAYGSDTQKVSDLLSKVAHDNERVLDSPAPQILFSSFGASTLDFTLRAFISGVADLVPTQSELHFEIDRAFRAAGVEIAFPQTDLHIRSLPSGAEVLSPDLTHKPDTAP